MLSPRSYLASLRYVGVACLMLGGTLPFVFGGCGSSATAQLCNGYCDCTSCSTYSHDLCGKTWDDNLKNADSIGCGAAVDAYVSCIEGGAQCIGADYRVGGCDVESRKLENCVTGTPGCTVDLTAAAQFLAVIHCK